MRHSDYRTTLAHYTVLGLTDTAKAVDALPSIRTDGDRAEQATGTTDAHAHDEGDSDPQLYPRQVERENTRFDTNQRDELRTKGTDGKGENLLKIGVFKPSGAKRATGVEPATFSLEG